MEKTEIQRLRQLPIVGVAERLGLEIKNYKTVCCFHDDHSPSLYFNVRKNSYRCFSCGAHGGTIDLTMRVLGKDFLDACRWLADENCIILKEHRATAPCREERRGNFDASRYERFFEHPWLSKDARRFLFDERRLHPAVVRFCRMNSYGDWLQIPYYNQQNMLVGIQRRYMGKDASQPRFRFQRGEQCHLYCQQVIPMLRPGEPIYLGEGPSDTWALLSSGKKAVGIPSATLLKRDDLLPLAGRECHIYPDRDAAGEGLYEKLLATANDVGFCLIRHELPDGCKDFSEYWASVNSLPVTG